MDKNKDLLFPDTWNPQIDPYSIPLDEIDVSNPDLF